jgi:hypothetical protein
MSLLFALIVATNTAAAASLPPAIKPDPLDLRSAACSAIHAISANAPAVERALLKAKNVHNAVDLAHHYLDMMTRMKAADDKDGLDKAVKFGVESCHLIGVPL